MTKRICSVPDCANPHNAKGYCQNHYNQWKRYGDPLIKSRVHYKSPSEAFTARTEWHGDCLVWTGTVVSKRYGSLKVEGKMVLSHRYAWETVNGPIPPGMFIDHICHNTLCCNIDHLRLATHAENLANRSGADSQNKSSSIRNVHRNNKGWRVRVVKHGHEYNFGTYPTIEEAAEVAEQARKELFGDFAGRS